MTTPTFNKHPCDLCGTWDAEEIECSRHYTGGTPIHVCSECGFVYIQNRRNAQSIADSWSNEIYGETYTAHIPAVRARQIYTAGTINAELDLKDKNLCDIGSGEGQFLILARNQYGANVFAVEPSKANCDLLTQENIPNLLGTAETYRDHISYKPDSFDIVTIMWTLENCEDCRRLMDIAFELTKPGGHVAISTGSRLLVPFKKPLYYYLGDTPPNYPYDTHAFRFSANTLHRLLAVTGYTHTYTNRYIDSDYLCMIGQKKGQVDIEKLPKDNSQEVLDFFQRWHLETENYYPKNN